MTALGLGHDLRASSAGREGVWVSLDHFVGAGEQRLRDGQTDCFRGGEIDDEIKFGWLLDRNGWQAVDLTMASAGSAASDEPDRMLTFAFIWVMSSRARRKQCPENNPCAMAQALWS